MSLHVGSMGTTTAGAMFGQVDEQGCVSLQPLGMGDRADLAGVGEPLGALG